MFNSLTGIITEKLPSAVCIDTHGIEWQLIVPGSALDALPPVGREARVFTYLVHTDDIMQLYGFSSHEERALFLDLIKVDGIGPRGAVKILSHISGSQLVAALDGGDVSLLEKVPGIGKKTAAKMMLALKGKLALSESPVASRAPSRPFEAVIVSLASMGYDKRNCEHVVGIVAAALADEDGWNAKKPTEKEDAVFRRALVELAQ
ncbi:MAG: Holliday junction branch migration protein RuvA [Treponema sp.]|nr:Holliday junction branch migration protein RuvA [Treponema sp.]